MNIEEKKLTDEEIVQAFENCEDLVACEGCPLRQPGCIVLALDLIRRLQADNIQLKWNYVDLKERYVKVLDLNEKVIAEQKAEIERLTRERTESAKTAVEVLEQNIELQKQVDELKEQLNYEKNYEKGVMIMKNVNELMNEIKEQCGDCEAWSGTDCTRNPYTQGCLKDENQVIECHGMLKGCDMVKQAVKDTAKEILPEMLTRAKRLKEQFDSITYGTNREHLIATIEIEIEGIKNLAKRYGVEVE